MKIPTTARPFFAALALLMTSAPAYALPGQTTAQLVAWAKANPALHGLTKKIEEMSGNPFYSATFESGSNQGFFNATLDEHGNVTNESLGIGNGPDNYDILKHPATAAALVKTVYGDAVAADMRSATLVGRWTMLGETSATALYRGTLYGYEQAHAFVKILPLGSIGAEAQQLKTCAKQECGD